MPVRLNSRAYNHARALVDRGAFVRDDRDMWSEHQPSTRQENAYIQEHGFAEYGKWYLGIDTDEDEDSKGRYRFPYGDFEKVHRCSLLTIESRAAQYKHQDIQVAAAHLHGAMDAARSA